MVIFPTFNSFRRQIEYGVIEHIKNIALSNKNIIIKILVTEEIDNLKQQEINLLLAEDVRLIQNQNNIDFHMMKLKI